MESVLQNFNVLYSRYYKKSFLFTLSYIRDEYAAEDIASESLIKLWEVMQTEEVKHPLSLLLTILKNKSLDYLKQDNAKKQMKESLAEYYEQDLSLRISTLQVCDPAEILSDEVQRIVAHSLQSLPEQTRRVFEMSRFEDLTGREIAERLGITQKGVEYHMSKALKSLKNDLKDYLPLFSFFFFYH